MDEWIGFDVGGLRKGFHAAIVDSALHAKFLEFTGRDAVARATTWATLQRPACVAVDSPAEWASPGRTVRACELDFARAGVCAIRFTPDEATAAARTDTYYEWIEHGLGLWASLDAARLSVIECFPTASWTQWFVPRGGQSRATWTRHAVQELAENGLLDAPGASNQDRRDALAAALTARQHDRHQRTTLQFGPLTIPRPGTDPLRPGH